MKLPLEQFLKRVLRPHEVNAIVNLPKEVKEGVSLGDYTSYNFEALQRFMDLWCERLDSLIAIDKELNAGSPSWKSHYATTWRGFTYAEYNGLFNAHVTVEEFPFYPVFTQLNKHKGGILNEKQRADFQARLVYDEESYIAALILAKVEPLLKTFFNDIANVKAKISLGKLRRHAYIVGSTGRGKSILMQSLFDSLVKTYRDCSFILLDPHGSLAESCKRLKSVSTNPNNVVYLDPCLKEDVTPTFNPFAIKDLSAKNVTFAAEQVISAMEETLSRVGGKLTEVQINTIEKCIYFLLYRQNSTILDLLNLLRLEETIFAEAQTYEPTFFNQEFSNRNNKTRKAVKDRTERLLNSPILKNLLGGESTFNLEEIINTKGKIIIVNLADVGELSQVAFGKFLIASIKSIVRKRKKNKAISTFLMVDEAHTMMCGSWEFMLSQLRGFGLHIILANQYLSQLDEQAESVKQNTAIKMVAFDDIAEVRKVIAPPENIHLKDYEFFLKVSGSHVQVFKSDDAIFKNPTQFEIDEKAEKLLDEYQLKHYYRPYEQLKSSPKEQPKEGKSNPPILSNKNNLDNPPFDLFINE